MTNGILRKIVANTLRETCMNQDIAEKCELELIEELSGYSFKNFIMNKNASLNEVLRILFLKIF